MCFYNVAKSNTLTKLLLFGKTQAVIAVFKTVTSRTRINVFYSIPAANIFFFKAFRILFVYSKSRTTPMKEKAFMFQLFFLYEFFLMFFFLFKNRKCQFFNILKNNGISYYEYNEHKTNLISILYFKKKIEMALAQELPFLERILLFNKTCTYARQNLFNFCLHTFVCPSSEERGRVSFSA